MAQDANSQLLNMLSPQEGKLLDDQLRRRQLQEGVTNYGGDAMGRFLTAASGAQRASEGFGMLGERLIGGRQKGANEVKAERQQDIIQQRIAKEEADKAAEKDNLADSNTILTTRSLKALEGIRDKAIAKNTTQSSIVAQQAQKKIEGLQAQIKELGITEKTVDTALDIVAASDLPEPLISQISDEVTNGLTKPQDINGRIKEALAPIKKAKSVETAIQSLDGFNLTEQEQNNYTNYLKGGGSLTTLMQKLIPTTESLTVDRLSQMYRFFTSESVDNFKKAFADGTRGADLPALKEQDSERKVNVSSVTPTMLNTFTSLVNENFEDPNVKAVFTDSGFFSEDPDKNKIKGYVADVYTYANKKQLLPSQALVEWSQIRNSGGEASAKVSENTKPEPIVITSPADIPQSMVDAVMKDNPNATEEQVRQAIYNKDNK